MDWYYAKDGQQAGPVSEDELRGLRDSGQLTGQELVWNETMADWAPMNSLPQFADAAETPAAPTEVPPATTASPTATASPYASTQPSGNLSPVTGANQQSLAPGEKIPTYLWQSIVCLILCCLPAAIPGIIYSTKVDPAIARGDIAGAKEASEKAKMWCWISFGLGLVANIVIFGASFMMEA